MKSITAWFYRSILTGAFAASAIAGEPEALPVRPPATAPAGEWPDLSGNTDGFVPRIYDVRDLLVPRPDFDHPPDLSLMGPTTQPTSNPAITPNESAEALMAVIRKNVAPDSWKAAKGSGGSMRMLQGQLIVSQKAENHQKIVGLLDGMRESRALEVTVEARFLAIDETLLKQEGPLQRLVTDLAGKDGQGEKVLNREQVQGLLRLGAAQPGVTLLSAPRVTLFSGQRAWVLVSTQQAYVKGYQSTVAADGKPATFEPEIETANSGICLDMQATLSTDRRSIALNLHPQLTHLLRLEVVPLDPAISGKKRTVQRPVLWVSDLNAKVNIPDDQTLLLTGFASKTVGGSTTQPALPNNATPLPAPVVKVETDGFGPGKRIFLLVKPTYVIGAAVGDGRSPPSTKPSTTKPSQSNSSTSQAVHPKMKPITYSRTGGFAGMSEKVSITPDGSITFTRSREGVRQGTLTPDQLAELVTLFEGWDQLESQYKAKNTVNDGFYYSVAWGEKTVASETLAPTPEKFEAVCKKIQALAMSLPVSK